MAVRRFWKGFAIGSAAGAGAAAATVLGWKLAGRSRGDGRILRIERSLQVGRPVDEVFRAWSDLESLPETVDFIESVEQHGDRSNWVMNIGGKRVEWSAEITQELQNQALGWKSLSGPKHTGRIDFSTIGNDTLVHVTMNYCPPGQMTGVFAPAQTTIERYMEEALRAFKFTLEGKGRDDGETNNVQTVNTSPTMQRTMSPTQMGKDTSGTAMSQEQRGTGTLGRGSESQTSRFGGQETVDYTRPPEAKS